MQRHAILPGCRAVSYVWLMQYMVVYQLWLSIAGSVLFSLDGARFSVVQVIKP